ncbi:MAG: ion channel [Bacteroidales bacterium]|nr:ion channel [Bacteroidales bacterium]
MGRHIEPRARHNLVLFILNVVYIFVIGIFEGLGDLHFVYFTCISLIFFVSILTIKDTSKRYFYLPTAVVILTWVTEFLDMPYLSRITGIVSTIFFLYVIVLLIIRVANSKSVGTLEFLESINVYLLLGIAAAILFGAIYSFDHSAYNPPGEILKSHSDFIYYAFVTMTTLGYGDITPNDSVARSLSIFFSVAG